MSFPPSSSAVTVGLFFLLLLNPNPHTPDSARTALYGPDALAKASPETTTALYLFGTPVAAASFSDTRRLRVPRIQPWHRGRGADRDADEQVHES